MDAQEQETGKTQQDWEDETGDKSLQKNEENDFEAENEENKTIEIIACQEQRKNKQKHGLDITRNSSSFVHGLSAGLGIGCIMAFVLMWIAVFFTPRIASQVTYETMLATFIYPLIYLFAVGLVGLTVGIVSERYTVTRRV